MVFLLPFMLTHLLIRISIRSQSYSGKHLERFGLYPEPVKPGGFLVHCVSVGEVMAATPLIRQLMTQHPDQSVTISCTTATGAEQIRQSFGNKVTQLYLPYDTPFMMRALLKKVRPQKVMITEVELWPNMLDLCWKRQISVYLINARMTDRSVRSYQKLKPLFQPMLSKLRAVGAQGQRDFDNYLKLGLNPEKLHLTHNIKFDLADSSTHQKTVTRIKQRFNIHQQTVLLAGSTHEPEEDIAIEAIKALQADYPDLLLILVPRHPQRFDTVEALLQRKKMAFLRTSEARQCQADTKVLLVDQMGMLTALYGLADMAFVGGSIANRGGHNALEPAAFGVPVMMGPHRYNNPEICAALTSKGALTLVNNHRDMIQICQRWLQQPAARCQAGEQGKQVLDENRGALTKTLAMLATN